jgi:hypothetical protein
MNDYSANSNLQLVPARRKQDGKANLSAYRPYTRALLRRYFRVSVDIGRLPSILGGLCFRARVSSYRLNTFEDAVIFVHDIERAFQRVERHYLEIIAGVILIEHSIPEAALRLGITVQRAERRYYAALDSLSAVLLEVGLLRRIFTGEAEDAHRSIPSGTTLPPRKPPVSARIEAPVPAHQQASNGQASNRQASITETP